MTARSYARRRDLAKHTGLVYEGVPPDEEALQRIEIDHVEDERLAQLALSSDRGAVDNAMDVKQAQIDVQHAEEALQKAKDAVDKAMAQENAHTARVREKICKEAMFAATVKRMLEPGFPSELFLIVLETAVRCERLRWRATEPESLNAAVDEFFMWPFALEQDVRTKLQRATGRALLQKAIIELPVDLTMSNGAAVLVLPLAILGNEQYIHHLVLDIKLDTRDGAPQRQLNGACHGLGALCLRLPKLEVFVVSLFLGGKTFELKSGSFAAGTLALRNQSSYKANETLETTLVRFFDVMHARGPGVRKLVRFTEQRRDIFAHAGLLVNVHNFVAPQVQGGASATKGPDEVDAGLSVGEQVLKQVYRYYRDATYRSAM
jgi:hypothetical protein